MKKVFVISLIITLIVILSIIVFYIASQSNSNCSIPKLFPNDSQSNPNNNYNSSNLKFSTGQFGDLEIYPNYPQSDSGILNQSWINQDTLIVEGYVVTFCLGATINGSYILNKNDLILRYQIKTGRAVTTCNSAHKVIYEISNLENKEYNISIQQFVSE